MKPPVVDFLCIGASKCGTSWLDALLRHHPDIKMPSKRKEIGYFSDYYSRGIDWYSNFFPTNREPKEIRGEITPSYFAHPEAPGRISAHGIEKLILILRNPIDRHISAFRQFKKYNHYPGDINSFTLEYPEICSIGCYSLHVEVYLRHFHPDQIKIITLEDLSSAPYCHLEALCRFLDVDFRAEFFPQQVALNKETNKATNVRFPTLFQKTAQLRRLLRNRDLDIIVNIATAVGAKRVFVSTKTNPDTRGFELDDAMLHHLQNLYSEDVQRLSQLVQIDVSRWESDIVPG